MRVAVFALLALSPTGGFAPRPPAGRRRDVRARLVPEIASSLGLAATFGSFFWLNGRLTDIDTAQASVTAAEESLRLLKLELVTGGIASDDAAARVAAAERRIVEAEAAEERARAVYLAVMGVPLRARAAIARALDSSPQGRAVKTLAIGSVVALLGWGMYVLSFDPVGDALAGRGGYSAPLVPSSGDVAEARARIDEEYAAMLREYRAASADAGASKPTTSA